MKVIINFMSTINSIELSNGALASSFYKRNMIHTHERIQVKFDTRCNIMNILGGFIYYLMTPSHHINFSGFWCFPFHFHNTLEIPQHTTNILNEII